MRFARYADDCNIYVRSQRAGQRVMASITRFITSKLKLKVNESKSAVARPWERKFLGFSFTREEQPRRKIAPKAVQRFKERVRKLTSRTRGMSIEVMAKELARYLRGWLGYFGKCQTPSMLDRLEQWLRRRFALCNLEAVEAGCGALRRIRVPPRLLRKYALRLWTTAQETGKCLFRLPLQLATTTVSQKQLFMRLSWRNRRSSWRLRKARIRYPWA